MKGRGPLGLRSRGKILLQHWFGVPEPEPDPEPRWRVIDKLSGLVVVEGTRAQCQALVDAADEHRRWRYLWQQVEPRP